VSVSEEFLFLLDAHEFGVGAGHGHGRIGKDVGVD